MANCHEVANYFLTLVDEELGDGISNLKMQKLVYFAQGFHLAIYNEPLFSEPIEAWQHGPVVPQLYHAFKEHGAQPIAQPQGFVPDMFSAPQRELLDEVFTVFGQFSAWKLRDITHTEAPWRDADARGERLISHESMKEYFKTRLIQK